MLSIIIPNYNRYIEIYDKVKNYKNFDFVERIIIVDDNSSDKKNYERISNLSPKVNVILNTVNSGPAKRRNQGLFFAGKYSVFLDSDDYLDCDWLQSCINKLDNNNSLDYVYAANRKGNSIYYSLNIDNLCDFFNRKKSNLLPTCLCVFKTDRLLLNKIFFPTILRNSEDTVFKVKIVKNNLLGEEVFFDDNSPLILGEIDEFSITRNWQSNAKNRFYKFLSGMIVCCFFFNFKLSYNSLKYSLYNLFLMLKLIIKK